MPQSRQRTSSRRSVSVRFSMLDRCGAGREPAAYAGRCARRVASTSRRSARPARPRSRRPARRAGAARARASAGSRRGRPRSRAGTPRSGARRRRSAGWCRSRSRRGGRPRRPRRCRSPGRAGPAPAAGSRSGSRACRRARRLRRRFRRPRPAARAALPPGRPRRRGAGRGSGSRTRPRRAARRARRSRGRAAARGRRPAAAEAEVRAGDDDLRPDRPQDPLRELLRLELGELEVEVDDERLLDPGLAEQLEPALERRQQLDVVAERDARMRVEGDDRRRRPGGTRGVEHAAMAEVDAVEGPERDRPRLRLELLHAAGDDHRRASASSGGEQPLGVGLLDAERPDLGAPQRRAVAAERVAIARTYVPELTRRSSRATPSR